MQVLHFFVLLESFYSYQPFETYLETNALRSPRHSSGKTGERYSFAIKDELRREVLKNNKNKKKEEAKNPLP